MPDQYDSAKGNRLVLIRLIVSVVFIVASLFIDSFLSIAVCILAALISGFDIAHNAADDISCKHFFSRPVITVLCSLILFLIGASKEAGLIFVAYRCGLLFIDYAKSKSFQTACEVLSYCNEKDKSRIEAQYRQGRMASSNYRMISASADSVLKAMMVFCIFFSVFTPMVFNFTYPEAIRRAISVISVCNVFSIIVSSDEISFFSLCMSAVSGVIFKNFQRVSDLSSCDSVAVELNGVLTKEVKGNVSFQSEVLDTERMVMLCAHAVYYSKQSLAAPILNIYSGEINEALISDFKEIPGVGVGISITGLHLVLASYDYYSRRGVDLPNEDRESGKVYYLTINGSYGGYVCVEESLDDGLTGLTDILKSAGIRKSALITDLDKNSTEQLAYEYSFDYYYPECNTEKMNSALADFKGKNGRLLYINSETNVFPNALINMSTNHESNGDLIYKSGIGSLGEVISVCDRANLLESENAIIAFVVKAIIIILALTGIGNVWFSVFIDSVGATITILNSLRLLKNNTNI